MDNFFQKSVHATHSHALSYSNGWPFLMPPIELLFETVSAIDVRCLPSREYSMTTLAAPNQVAYLPSLGRDLRTQLFSNAKFKIRRMNERMKLAAAAPGPTARAS